MKAKFETTQNGNVIVEYDDPIYGSRIRREFAVPRTGGYVREFVDGELKQVCDALSNRGSTLYINTREALPALIRREYRAMRRAEAKALNG